MPSIITVHLKNNLRDFAYNFTTPIKSNNTISLANIYKNPF